MSLKAGLQIMYVYRIIGQKFFLKLDINFICQFFYETEFKQISKRQFETSEAMCIIRYAMLFQSFHKEFVQSYTSIFITYS
jgi:hypothetical protein